MDCIFCGSGKLEWSGKSLRCPNPACRMVWVPKNADQGAKPPEAEPKHLDAARCPTCGHSLDRRGYCPNCGWYRTKLRTDDKNISELG